MGEVWYTHSLTTNFNGQWRQDICISNTIGNISKNPSIDFEGNKIKIVFETALNEEAAIYLLTFIPDVNGNYIFSEAEEVLYYPLSYFGNAKPVIAYNSILLYVAYRKNTTDGLYQKTKWNFGGNWQWGAEDPIPNTTSYSSNPSVVGISNNIHVVYQHSLGIRYILAFFNNYVADYINYAIISTGCGYTNNYSPSISLVKNNYPVVSWVGYNYTDPGGGEVNKVEGESPTSKIVVRRAKDNSWSSFFKAGYNAVTTNNNSTSSTLNEESIIAWSEGSSPNFLSKWVRRVNGSYTDAHSLSHNGKQNQVSNGTSIDNIEGTVFTITQLPYMLSLVTTDFNQQFSGGSGLNKAGELIELSYGREGVIYKNGVEFLFNIGDIIVGDSVIKFIEQPDTILYSSAEELNTVVKTVPFYLSASTEFYFTDFYYVLNDSLADTSLTAEDEVNFKVELINNQSGQVIGTFDNITYTKEYLDKYANVSYQVDCSNIASGNYFLRLVTTVAGEAEYHLGNVQNSGEELSKHNYQRINFNGTELPESYSLEQNYPNPFNPNTTIKFQIPKEGMVTLKVYDILGAEVAILVDEEKVAGKYEVNFDANNLASGIYIYCLNVNDFANVKKMVLLK
ncbi:MAG: T9SS type A sorting domain-containing protein [Ignavibacteriota bacterium]|nr:T9SS type A sorting domain-containing protein [Ignavibacteriales bacterium]QKJ97930.1 MAG: T9SS type A sorting domain-containing protein [Ignavibacteriota bacterium]